MLFNSFAFAVFFPVVLFLHWGLPHRARNILLLAASYVFYGFWDTRFLFLIGGITLVDFTVGVMMQGKTGDGSDAPSRRRRNWLLVSLVANLGALCIFKYYNFFTAELTHALDSVGAHVTPYYLNLILPVGISFYTFRSISYTVDVYRGKIAPESNLVDYALYVSFFPLLMAGPIERAGVLLPQIKGERRFSRAQFLDGANLIFLGLFKKVYVADNLKPFVDQIFSAGSVSAMQAIFGTYAFAFQIYCDFSGYSDIALGCAKCLGMELNLNFNHPYWARNPSDFWRRWHISLSGWLRDYLYIPLGGNRLGRLSTYKNLAITMLLAGLWHGAAWNYIVWGGYHGLLLIGQRIIDRFSWKKERVPTIIGAMTPIFAVIVMFHLACLGWLMFRAESLHQIGQMVTSVLRARGGMDIGLLSPLLYFVSPLVLIEGLQYAFSRDDLYHVRSIPVWAKQAAFAGLFYLIVFHGASVQSFIYFQF